MTSMFEVSNSTDRNLESIQVQRRREWVFLLIAGIFLGKVVTGTYSGGFQYSVILVLIAFASIMLIQSSIVSVNALF